MKMCTWTEGAAILVHTNHLVTVACTSEPPRRSKPIVKEFVIGVSSTRGLLTSQSQSCARYPRPKVILLVVFLTKKCSHFGLCSFRQLGLLAYTVHPAVGGRLGEALSAFLRSQCVDRVTSMSCHFVTFVFARPTPVSMRLIPSRNPMVTTGGVTCSRVSHMLILVSLDDVLSAWCRVVHEPFPRVQSACSMYVVALLIVELSMHACIQPCMYACIHPPTHPPTHPYYVPTHPPTHPPTHHPLTHPLTHSPTHPPTHPDITVHFVNFITTAQILLHTFHTLNKPSVSLINKRVYKL